MKKVDSIHAIERDVVELRHRSTKPTLGTFSAGAGSGSSSSAGTSPLISPISSYYSSDKEHYNQNYNQNSWQRLERFVDSVVDGIVRYDLTTALSTLFLAILSIVSRVWNIGKADFVVWDEAHFGKFASHYLKREFYFDVHPPLGKILVGLAGLLSGYTGDFAFESGHKYPATLNYTLMRIFLSLFGALTVPLAYLTCLELGLRRRVAVLAALMVLCDNAYLSISRYILLDSMLLFFTVSTVYCMAAFHHAKQRDRGGSFSGEWWFWLCATGWSIGMVSSVKWVGFFVTALVGLYTIEDLWTLFGDLTLSKIKLVQHFLARVLGLILVPFAIYLFSFKLHFAILAYSGPGDAQMSSLFQAQLVGSNFHENPLYVAYGSVITLKNNGYGGGLLHSHVQTFPAGSKQQQVTAYHYKDENNKWIVKHPREHHSSAGGADEEEVEFVKNGDVIRLVHQPTARNLHSHPLAAPVSKVMGWEVSCYGNEEVGDVNDYWRVEVLDDISVQSNLTLIRSLTTRLRLVHVPQKCQLRSHNVVLPEWGFKQSEVLCDKHNRSDLYNVWNIEQHWNPALPAGEASSYKTSFWKDFLHLNVGMYTSNNALTPDPDKEPDGLTSNPSDWPLLSVGLRMCGWGDGEHKVFLLGNPVIWWGGVVSLVLYGVIWFVSILRQRRGCQDWRRSEWESYCFVGKYFLLGWLLHFIPFGLMARVTYLHHYFPALYFCILMMAYMTEVVISLISTALESTGVAPRVVRAVGWMVYTSVCVSVLGVFGYFAPLSYGFDGPANVYSDRKWREGWRIHD